MSQLTSVLQLIARHNLGRFLAAAGMASCVRVAAGQATWVGDAPVFGSVTLWTAPGNWSSGAVPPDGSDVIFGTGFASGTSISLANNATVGRFTIDTATPFTVLSYTGSSLTINGGVNRTGTSTGQQIFSSAVQVNAYQMWNLNGSGGMTVSGGIGGTGGFVKLGVATLTLTGTNTYAGPTMVDDGLLILDSAVAGAALNPNSSLVIDPGGTVQLGNQATHNNVLGLGTNAPNVPIPAITINGGGTLTTATGTTHNLGLLTLSGGRLAGDGNPAPGFGDFTLNSTVAQVGNAPSLIYSAGGVGLRGTITFDVAPTVGTSADLSIYASLHSEPGSQGGVMKTNSGTLLLAGTDNRLHHLNVSGGSVILSGGSLTVDSQDIGGSPAVAISANSASLIVRSGETLDSSAGDIAQVTGPANNPGTMTVTGAGTRWLLPTFPIIGYDGSGTFTADDHASLSGGSVFFVGYSGTGSARVQGGATITTPGAGMGINDSDSGTLIVTGSGSSLTTDHLGIGGYGRVGGVGTLTVSAGGAVTTTGITELWTTPSSITVSGGTLVTGYLFSPAGAAPTLVLTDPTGGTALTINGGPSTNTFSGNISGTGSILKTGASQQYFLGTNTFTGGVTANGGFLYFGPSAVPAHMRLTIGPAGDVEFPSQAMPAQLELGSLSLAPGGILDTGNSTVLIDYPAGASPAATIRSLIAEAYHGGLWDGPGLRPKITYQHALGYADWSAGTVPGQPANTIELKYTVPGDTNLDGTVNFADLLGLAQHYGQNSATWDQGDLNYDGVVNFADLLLLAQNYGGSLSAVQLTQLSPSFLPDVLRAFAQVPEPAALLWICCAALLTVHQRPRRHFCQSPA